jgi:hypothetical protein
MWLLPLSGLVSGLVTSVLIRGSEQSMLNGIVFALFLTGCLGILGILHSYWKAATLIVITTAAYFCAYYVAFGLQLQHPDIVRKAEQGYMGSREPASPIALFVGGLVGGFIVFGALMILFRPGKSFGGLVLKVLVGTVLSGILGVVGWTLRSSVGAGVWHAFHIFHLTPPSELSPREYYHDEFDYGETTRMYSVYVVWQTGVAAAAAVMLRPVRAALKVGPSSLVKGTPNSSPLKR